ncbi:serine hydrolase, partial [Candidatus Saccharibacteria bacterium]|nr:serine hydrolase [Candidatus Saccharibacteria bacterium]
MRPVRLRTQTRQKKRSDTRRYILLGALVAMMSVGLYLLQVRHFTSVADTSNPSQRQNATETNPAKGVKTDSSAELQTAVDAWLESHGSRYRVVVQSLDDSTAATYQADVPIVPASTYKLFVAFAAYHQIEAGQLSLATTLSNGMTIEQCLKKAIVQSDNACAEAIGFKIGWSTVDQLIAAAGFSQTRLNNYAVEGGYTGDKQSSAADLGNLLTKLYQGKLVDAVHTDSLLG